MPNWGEVLASINESAKRYQKMLHQPEYGG